MRHPREPREGRPSTAVELMSDAYSRDCNVADPAGSPTARPGTIAFRLAVRALLVLPLLAVADVIVRRTLPPERLLPYMQGEETAYTVKVARLRSEPVPDVLLLGSSRVRDGMVPSVFAAGLEELWGRPARAFNLGLPNAKVEECLALVRSHLPEPAPAFVVLGICGSEVVQAQRFQFASRFLWRWPDLLDWARRVPDGGFDGAHVESWLELELGRIWYVFRHRDALRGLITEAVRRRIGADPSDAEELAQRASRDRELWRLVLAPDGYAAPTEHIHTSLRYRLDHDPGGVSIPPRELEACPEMRRSDGFIELRRIAALLEARGSRLAVVEMPASPYLQRLSPVMHGAPFRRRMAELARELGITWVPMDPRDTQLSDAVYLDAGHLSPAGALRYTRLLSRKLQARGFFDPVAQ